jgi:hypothetical protein
MTSQLPVYGVENDALLSKRGDYTLPFRLHKSEIFTLSADQYESLHNAYVKGLRVLPPNTIVHQQDWFLTDQFKADPATTDKTFLAGSSDRFVCSTLLPMPNTCPVFAAAGSIIRHTLPIGPAIPSASPRNSASCSTAIISIINISLSTILRLP